MNEEQATLIQELAEIIAMIAEDYDTYDVEYIRERYLIPLALNGSRQ